jgi:hypothetical protein
MNLAGTFQKDITAVARELISAFDLKYEEDDPNLSSPLLRWLDFRRRYIESFPRAIIRSTKFPRTLDTSVETALGHIEGLITSGADINPYQSKGLALHNDTSSAKRQLRTDLLLADWGIHHLHLTTNPIQTGKFFSDRSEWLLFCIFGKDFAGLVDVRHHGEEGLFSDQTLLETVIESWPELVEKFRLKDMRPASDTGPTSQETASLRKGGVSSFIKVGNEFYFGPGMGVTTASTSTMVSMSLMRINRLVNELAKLFSDPTNNVLQELSNIKISDPDFHLGISPSGLCVHERKSNRAYVLPRMNSVDNGNWLAELNERFAPMWAVQRFIANATA